MITAQLGDARQDVYNLISSIPVVGSKLSAGMSTFETYLKSEAKAGAEEAVPDITQKVHDEASATIKPYILLIGGISVLALAGSITALVKFKRFK
jgi:hypothetical protein